MLEIEIKVKINNPEELKRRFSEHNGTYKISLVHADTYFNMPIGLRDFSKSDEALRIRESKEFNRHSTNPQEKIKYFITYKGKKIDNFTKTRNEIETQIEDGKILKDILKSLDFRDIFTVEKERELYEFDFKGHHIEALIDYIPLLNSYFLEVEIVSNYNSNEEIEKYRNILFEFLSIFNIKKEQSIIKSYLELIANKFRGKLAE